MSSFFKLVLVSVIACSVGVSTATNAGQDSKFAEYSKKQKEKYKKFKTDYLDRYEKYRTEIKEKWGVAELSSKTEYVHYNDETKTKVLTDFEHDSIEVSILESDDLSDQEVDKIIRKAIVDSLDKQPEVIANSQIEFDVVDKERALVHINSLDKQSEVIANNQVEFDTVDDKKEQALLQIEAAVPTVLNHLGIESPEKLTDLLKKIEVVPAKQQEQVVIKRTEVRLTKQISNLENFTSNTDVAPEQVRVSKALIVSLKKEKSVVAHDANELTKKNIKTYKINLRRDRYKKAEQYLKMVRNNAQKWALSDQFILAVMETESHFNPLAKSYVPAYGLMQIVPSTAGADVNTKILGIKNKPSPDLLFSGRDNIKYGSAYIHILMTRYLKEIENPTSRLYCAIASYNTGIGNVARAFNHGKKGRLKAMKVINTLSPDEVYDIIKKRTHTETQRYLDKVLESKQYFTQQKV
jgi:membrane-bound lytic murein transglycosylase C